MKNLDKVMPELLELKAVPMELMIENGSFVKKMIRKIKKSLQKNEIDLSKLKKKSRKKLGFGTWSKDSTEFGLIPLYIFRLLDDDVKVICPFFDDEKPKLKSKADTDVRFGCVAYEFYKEK